jgi:hypothetical protein
MPGNIESLPAKTVLNTSGFFKELCNAADARVVLDDEKGASGHIPGCQFQILIKCTGGTRNSRTFYLQIRG